MTKLTVTQAAMGAAPGSLKREVASSRDSHAQAKVLERPRQRAAGGISIDLLNRQAVHSAGHNVSLQIVPHLADWLSRRLHSNDARIEDLAHARLALVFRTDVIPTIRTGLILFDWACVCTIAPLDGVERSGEARGRAWYHRSLHRPGCASASR